MKFKRAVLIIAVGVLTAALIGCGGNNGEEQGGETELSSGSADLENAGSTEPEETGQQDALPVDEENGYGEEYIFDHGIQYGYATDEYADIERYPDVDLARLPTFIDGVDLMDNSEWNVYHSTCRHCSAFTSQDSCDPSYNLNFFEVNGVEYKLPMLEMMFPWERSMMDNCPRENYTENFRGWGYGIVDPGVRVIWGNKIFLQSYPDSNVINAVHIESKYYTEPESDSDIQVSIAGISLGMSEDEVIAMYGEGMASSQDYSTDMFERMDTVPFDGAVYKNPSGILVISYEDDRCVNGISLYSYALNQCRTIEGVIPVEIYYLQGDDDGHYMIFYTDEEGGFALKGEPGRGTYEYDPETGIYTLDYNGEQLYEGGHHLVYEAYFREDECLVVTKIEDLTTGETTEGVEMMYSYE